MVNEENVALLRQGVKVWNQWRDTREQDSLQPDLSHANLNGIDLTGAKLHWTNLHQASLRGTVLNDADLFRADLIAADLSGAKCRGANFEGAFFTSPNADAALLCGANLSAADLTGARLPKLDLTGVNLTNAKLVDAQLAGSILERTDLRSADLAGANLSGVLFIGTHLEGAKLRDCMVYGCSAWNVQLDGAVQTNLRISRWDEPSITVDNLEVAQFLYLMLYNQKIRDVIDTLTSKVVLILGRFTPERKAVLDALREALRQRNYVPVLFDFEGPESHDFTETVTLLARMARFIIADLTEPASIPQELQAIVPDVMVPVQPVIAEGAKPFSMFADHCKYHWMLPIYRYASPDALLAALHELIIVPAEAKAREVRRLRQAKQD